MCFGHEPFEVLQVIQATGWRAVYERDGQREAVPLACFALVKNRDDGFTFLAGMNTVADDKRVIMPSDFDEENEFKFLGYLSPGESIEKFNLEGGTGNVSKN